MRFRWVLGEHKWMRVWWEQESRISFKATITSARGPGAERILLLRLFWLDKSLLCITILRIYPTESTHSSYKHPDDSWVTSSSCKSVQEIRGSLTSSKLHWKESAEIMVCVFLKSKPAWHCSRSCRGEHKLENKLVFPVQTLPRFIGKISNPELFTTAAMKQGMCGNSSSTKHSH